MSDVKEIPVALQDQHLDDLMNQLQRRTPDHSGPPSQSRQMIEEERGYTDRQIIDVVIGEQKVIYGADDRVDLFEVTDARVLKIADAVVSLWPRTSIRDNGDGTSTLQTQQFGIAQELCSDEPFFRQPIGANCSGFLVAPDIIATAGHCVDASSLANVRFVFGFKMLDANSAQTTINNQEIYRGTHLIGHQLTTSGEDWALVRLDRPVTNHAPAPIRRNGTIARGQSVYVIGHPVGLPIKYAPGANVRDNQPVAYFVANLDTYGGNSGSLVVNADTHVVEGILVRGETDFAAAGSCFISLVCPTTGCRGEDCTRATRFSALVP